MPEYNLKVSPEEVGQRLDVFLAGFFKQKKLGLSSTAIQDLIRAGSITIKNIDRPKPHYKLKNAEEIKFHTGTAEDRPDTACGDGPCVHTHRKGVGHGVGDPERGQGQRVWLADTVLPCGQLVESPRR
jgi:hypothetical protein